MAVPQIGKIASVIKDPMVSDHFQLEFPEVPTGQQDEEPLLISCQQAMKPGMTLNQVEVQLFGHTLEFAGNLTYGHDLSVTFVENVRGSILRTLEKWVEIARGHTTQHGEFKAGYSRDAVLSIFDNKGDTVLKYKIFGVWPSQLPDTQFDGTNSTLITHAVTFKYDYFEIAGGYGQ